MRKLYRRAAFALLSMFVIGCLETDEPVLDNPFDPHNGAGMPVPDSIVVTVGSNLVRLEWGLGGQTADEFAVFRRRIDTGSEAEILQSRVQQRFYVDTSVRNGRAYEYRISAGRNGQFGERSESIEARPGLFTILLANDAPLTRNTTVQITLDGPGANFVRFTENLDSITTWRPVATSISWTLSAGDGSKTVYGVFQLADGSETEPVSDAIVLDTQALIRSVDFEGTDILQPGATIRFRLDAAEVRGEATIDVPGLYSGLQLFDDGSNGDAIGEDGIYFRQTTIPAGRTIASAVVTGRFTDEAGNAAAALDGVRTLTVQHTPLAVSLLEPTPALPPDAASVTLRWTQSPETAFAAYRVFRSQTAAVDSADLLAGTVTSRTTLELVDRDVVEGRPYAYRVFVMTTAGLQTGSNLVRLTLPNLRPPQAVTLQQPEAASTTRVVLEWTRNQDEDFQAYRVYRNDTGAVSETDPLIASITNQDQTFFDDVGLVENTEHFYRVYVFDNGGLSARGNEVEARPRNVAPPAVVLNAATAIDTTAATLSWSGSNVHDFEFFRLYRDETATVTVASHLVVEIDESTATSFRDTGLRPATPYWYRVFVVDDSEDPTTESTGSNTIAITTADTTGMFNHDSTTR